MMPEKSLNIVAPVKFYRQLTDFIRGKGSPFYIGVTVVLAVGAVKNTFIGKEDLEQRNTAPVRRERVTDPTGEGVPHAGAIATAVHTAGSTGNIVFCSGGKYRKFFH